MRTDLLEREGPLRALDTALDEAAREHGSVVVISGEPGIGKSALVSSFAADHAPTARVLFGICDDLTIPRPLGAFRDLAKALPDPVATVLGGGQPPGEFATLLIRELRRGRSPTAVILEDVHWADQATTDVLTVIARRLAELPVLLVLTLRLGELAPDDPLRSALAAMHRSTVRHVELAPLSRAAVAQLAGDDATRIHELSRGNPFFVTELLAHGTQPPPPSLANVVLGRVARLDTPSRQLLELVSVVPGRVPTHVLDLAEPDWAAVAEQAERRRLLTIDTRHVRFRHDLTRAAIRSSLPHGRRRRLHRRILEVLLEVGADPADVVHHAEGAGATEVVAEHALAAARHAAAAGANREAFAHYQRAAELAADRLESPEQAALFEELARSASLTGHRAASISSASRAIVLAEEVGDTAAHGRCSSMRAQFHWLRGDGEAAWRDACAAVRSLEASGPSLELARAYAQSSELSMTASRGDDTLHWGQRALQLAGDADDIRARALAAIGGMQLQVDIDDVETLLQAVEVASGSGCHDQVVFTLVTLAYVNLLWVRPDTARRHAEQGRDYARTHEFDGMVTFLDGFVASLEQRAGHLDTAATLARGRPGAKGMRDGSLGGHQVEMALAELAVRRGDADADVRLRDVASFADRTGDVLRIAPVLELQVERALTQGAPLPVERFEQLPEIVGQQALAMGVGGCWVAAWASVCGLATRFSGKASVPHAAMIAGDWRGAADAFAAVGWHHAQALLLSLLDTEDALTEALDIARSLSATPLEQRVRRRMRTLGFTVPRGPLTSTRSNPAQLTDRQLEVLQHVCDGQQNARIAELLHISPRTVEHHVSGILTKLEVSSRTEAVARCGDLGIT